MCFDNTKGNTILGTTENEIRKRGEGIIKNKTGTLFSKVLATVRNHRSDLFVTQ